jgi:3-hydroxyacyl-CoA dehydrogenase, NAD binding domain
MKTTDKRDSTTTHIAAVTVLGTGVLGSQIAYQTAYSGFDVVAYDINDEALTAAKKRFAGLAAAYKQQVRGAAAGRADAAQFASGAVARRRARTVQEMGSPSRKPWTRHGESRPARRWVRFKSSTSSDDHRLQRRRGGE